MLHCPAHIQKMPNTIWGNSSHQSKIHGNQWLANYDFLLMFYSTWGLVRAIVELKAIKSMTVIPYKNNSKNTAVYPVMLMLQNITKKWKFHYNKMHQFHHFHGLLHAAENPSWPRPPKDWLNWCHCELCKQWRNVSVLLTWYYYKAKKRILLNFEWFYLRSHYHNATMHIGGNEEREDR